MHFLYALFPPTPGKGRIDANLLTWKTTVATFGWDTFGQGSLRPCN